MQVGFILSLVFAILVTVFALQNSEVVDVNFLFANVPVSQALVIFISAALGAIIVTILGLFRQFKLSRKIKEQNKDISKLKSELDDYQKDNSDEINTEERVVESNKESNNDTKENDESNKSNATDTEKNKENIS